MATKCPRCGSKNTECINRGAQVLETAARLTGAAICELGGRALGFPNVGKYLSNRIGVSPQASVYKCKSCGNEFKP